MGVFMAAAHLSFVDCIDWDCIARLHIAAAIPSEDLCSLENESSDLGKYMLGAAQALIHSRVKCGPHLLFLNLFKAPVLQQILHHSG